MAKKRGAKKPKAEPQPAHPLEGSWFDDRPVIRRMPAQLALYKWTEIGSSGPSAGVEAVNLEVATRGPAAAAPVARSFWSWWGGEEREAWEHTAHVFGFIEAKTGSDPLPIRDAGEVDPDESLKKARITVTLDRLRVAKYPGEGVHRVLFDFYAENRLAGGTEPLHFNNTLRVREGESAAVVGYPIFVGLNVGGQGVAFKCFTVNVQNDEDQAFLGFLDSDVFKSGLQLATTVQPALGPLSSFALGLTKMIAGRHQNVPVQDFYLGLDFTTIRTRARLREGSYLAVQVPQDKADVWDWGAWAFKGGQIVPKDGGDGRLPYNYLVFSVSRYTDD